MVGAAPEPRLVRPACGQQERGMGDKEQPARLELDTHLHLPVPAPLPLSRKRREGFPDGNYLANGSTQISMAGM
jgi:hypothetical protein